MLSKFIIIIIKYLSSLTEIEKVTDLIDVSIKILNKYCDYLDVDTFLFKKEEEHLILEKKTDINFLKYINTNNIISSVFLISSTLIVFYYFNTVYHDVVIENIQQIHDKIWIPTTIINKSNPQIVLVKASKSFLFYKESDIIRINAFRKKRFLDFLKEMKEKNESIIKDINEQ